MSKKRLSTVVDEELLKRLKHEAIEADVDLCVVLDKALREYFKRLDENKKE